MRSKLFVPGSRPELFAKAFAGEADAVSIDLEDAVEASRKAEARTAVAAFLSGEASTRGKLVIVRANALSTPHFEADVAAVVGPRLGMLNLSKVETADDVVAATAALSHIERARGLERPTPLLVNIETPRALRQAHAIAAASPRVAGLQLGLADLLEPLGIARDNAMAISQIQLAVRLAAGEAGVIACDAAFADVGDLDGFRAEAQRARRLGYVGKSCIHPAQVPAANAVFRPGAQQIAHALRVVAASREAAAKGIGAYLVDGQMIDGPFARRAEAIVADARRLGLLPQEEADP